MDLFTGWVDIPLSLKGLEESKQAGRKLRGIPIDIAFTSTLIRAQMTLFLALAEAEQKKCPVIIHEKDRIGEWGKIYNEEIKKELIPVYESWQLNERMYGALQGMNKEEMRKKFGPDQVKIWRRSYDVAPPEGESLKMTKERTIPYYKDVILPQVKAGKNVLVAAHGNSIRSILMDIDHLSEQEVVSLEIPLGEPLFYEADQL